MNKRVVLHIVSIMTLVIGIAMGLCGVLSRFWGDPIATQLDLLQSSGITMVFAVVLLFLTRGDINLSRRDGFGVVTFGWIFASAFGALPYLLSGVIPHPVSAFFETVSGFTTTGASVLPAGIEFPTLECIPRGILFWRALTHWFGGMGVLVLCVAILPFLGVGGMQIYRAEMPGPSKDRLTPRITTTAKLLWVVYALLTLIETLLLRFVGKMSWFDSICHSFATMATGGFSTRTASIAAYNSLTIECILIAFMFLAAVNFSLHYYAFTGKPNRYFKDPEFRFYLLFWVVCSLFIAANLWPTYQSIGASLRVSFFQTISVLTTTGFVSADFNIWPQPSRMLLIIMMFVGGCAGSTAGGIKVVRIMIMGKKITKEIRQFMRPQAVLQVKLGAKPVEAEVVANIAAFFTIFVLVFVIASFLMTFYTPDLESAATSVIATLSNIGPGLNAVGPTQNFAAIPAPGQAILSICMLLGRLELYTVLILFLPSFWKR